MTKHISTDDAEIVAGCSMPNVMAEIVENQALHVWLSLKYMIYLP
jgi:hypothetical protein